MTLLLTPRYGGTTGGLDTFDGILSHGGAIKKKLEKQQLSRARVIKRKLAKLRGEEQEPLEIEIQDLPPALSSELANIESNERGRYERLLKELLLKQLYSLLLKLETAQISEMELLALWQRLQEEELILMMMMDEV